MEGAFPNRIWEREGKLSTSPNPLLLRRGFVERRGDVSGNRDDWAG